MTIMRRLLNLRPTHWRNDYSGLAAVEFSLLAPFLLFMTVGLADTALMIYQRTDIHASVRSGAQYFMSGGRDVEQSKEIVLKAWNTKSDTSYVDAIRFCMCGTTAWTCSAVCADKSIPDAYHRIRAVTVINGIISKKEYQVDETIRVR